MKLCVDIGNSNTVIGIYRNNEQIARWRILTDRHITHHNLMATFHSLLSAHNISKEAVCCVVISSVVPTWNHSWTRLSKEYLSVEPSFIHYATDYGITLSVNQPQQVGADRIVNAVAAYHEAPEGALIIDSGTAITVDVVTPNAEYIGGAIMPGILISLEALVDRTAQLPRVMLDTPAHAIGTTTEESLKSGIFFGFVGMIDKVINEIIKEISFSPTIIATGGLAGHFTEASEYIQRYERDLTLTGLSIIGQRIKERS